MTDEAGAAVGYVRTVADQCGVSDSAARIVGFVRSFSDAEGVSDVFGRVAAFVRTIADAEGLTDEATATLIAGVQAAVIAIILEQQTRN